VQETKIAKFRDFSKRKWQRNRKNLQMLNPQHFFRHLALEQKGVRRFQHTP
jgi:hypothetical protein